MKIPPCFSSSRKPYQSKQYACSIRYLPRLVRIVSFTKIFDQNVTTYLYDKLKQRYGVQILYTQQLIKQKLCWTNLPYMPEVTLCLSIRFVRYKNMDDNWDSDSAGCTCSASWSDNYVKLIAKIWILSNWDGNEVMLMLH